MSILQVTPDSPGLINIAPRIVRIQSNDSFATITALNYLQVAVHEGFAFNTTDIIAMNYGTNSLQFGWFQPQFTIANGMTNITLQPFNLSEIPFDVTVTAAALASGGSVILMTSYPGIQYKVRRLQLNSGGTNFSGGGGDRLGQVTDGTTVYSVIPAATMQSLANAQWGVTALPNPAAAAINTSTVAGANLLFKYSGGTTDYSTGSLVISGLVQRVA